MNGSVTQKLRRLAELPESRFPVLSVYLDTKNDAPNKRDQVRIFLKTAIRDALAVIDGNDARASFESDADRILRFVGDEMRLEGAYDGHAIFACSGADLFDVIHARRPFANAFLVGRRPLVRQLAVMLDEYEPLAVAVVDSRSARIFEVSLDDGVSEHALQGDVPRVGNLHEFHGFGDLKYRRDLQGHIEAHWRDVGDYLGRLVDRGIRRIVVLGQDQVVQNFRKALPRRVDERVIATGHMDKREARDRIVQKALEVVAREERREEDELVTLIRDQALSGNLGVFGLEATVNALRKGQVYKLAIAGDLRARGWRCRGCAALLTHLRQDACPHCGGRADVVELGDEIVKDALGQGAEIETVQGHAGLARMGKVGALLRFRE
jgi:hypothetical protein